MSAIKRLTPPRRKYISAKGLYAIADQFNLSPASAPSRLCPPRQPLLSPLVSLRTCTTDIRNALITGTAAFAEYVLRAGHRDEGLHTPVRLILQQLGAADAISNSTLQ